MTWLLRGARVLVTLCLGALLIYLVDLRRVMAVLLDAQPVPLVAAVGVAVADRFLMIGKWYPLLKPQLPTVSIVAAGRAYLASGVAHYVLPASVGADVLRAVALGWGQRVIVEIGASIAAERVLGLLASAIMAGVAVALAARDGVPLGVIAPWALLAIALGALAMIVPMSARAARAVERLDHIVPGRWWGYVQRLVAAYGIYKGHPRTLGIVAVLSLLEQLFPVGWYLLGAYALGIEVGVSAMVVAVTLTLFASRLPISVGGLGVGEGALVYLLGLYGVSPSDALAVALAARAVEVLVNAGPGIVLWRDLVRVRRAV